MSGFVPLKGLAAPIAVEHQGRMTEALASSHETLNTSEGRLHAVIVRKDEGHHYLRIAQSNKGLPIDIPAEAIGDFIALLNLVRERVP